MLSNFKSHLTLVLVLFLPFINCKSEEIVKVKFGKVTMEELQMQKYELDTAAEAVILYEYAEFVPEYSTFVQHIRVKVLKKTATDIASMVFDGKVKNKIKGCTYNLENGEIVKTKLKAESIFEELVIKDSYRTRVAMPNVKQGSVFELEVQQEWLPYTFEIQRNIPIIYGAFVFPLANLKIRIKEIGYLNYSYKGEGTWIVKDLPAYKDEPYSINEGDYKMCIEFERTTGLIGGWERIVGIFHNYYYLDCKVIEPNLYMNELADSIKQTSKDEATLAKNAFEAMKKMHWNNNASSDISQDLKKSFKQKEGNSADINLNLLILLKKLDLKCYPVVFSTRRNGKVSKFSYTINKFNYVVAAVDLPSGTVYLDATDEFLPFGLLPDRLYGCTGLPIDKDKKADCSVSIQPTQKDKKVSFSKFTIDSTGSIKGNIAIQRIDYNAIDFKNLLKDETDHDTYIQELETSNSGWTIDNYKFNNLDDPYKEFSSEYEVNYSSSIGANDVVVFNPLVFVKMNGNPFKNEKRMFPINFYEPIDYSSTVSIVIPTNYSLSEFPKNISITNLDKTAKFTYSVFKSGNTIEVKTKFNVDKINYSVAEYNSLRNFYETMLQKLNESIILKRIQ